MPEKFKRKRKKERGREGENFFKFYSLYRREKLGISLYFIGLFPDVISRRGEGGVLAAFK